MSNHLAIATVTAAIKNLLHEEIPLDTKIGDIIISTKPPDKVASEANTLNLFLYQVTPNIAYRNLDLSSHSNPKFVGQIPQQGLNLNYLLTVYSSDDIVAQQILASAMRILYEKPILTREIISNAINSNVGIKDSNLADQAELVKLSLQPLSLDDITKLWSSFFQTHYRISVSYQATVVLLDSKQEPIPSLPVKERRLYVNPYPFTQPLIDKIEPQILEHKSGAKLTLQGRNLKADTLTVKCGEDLAAISSATDSIISIKLPDKSTAGIKSVQIVHKLALGSGFTSYESNVVAFVLVPRITTPSPILVQHGTDLTLNFEPAVTPQQKVSLLIGDSMLSVPPLAPADNKLSVPIPDDLRTGVPFLLRMRVDGAESFLKPDDTTNNLGPVIIIT